MMVDDAVCRKWRICLKLVRLCAGACPRISLCLCLIHVPECLLLHILVLLV